MRRRLHIIAACADRKRAKAPPRLCLRNHRSSPRKARFQSFIEALDCAAGVAVPAVELYLGGYWAAVRDLPGLADSQGFRTTLWVASAGYGLIPSSALVHPYSATFQTGVPDSVAQGSSEHAVRDQVSAWWSALSTWAGPPAGSFPRTVSALAASDPASTLIVIASPRYIQALSPDLMAAAKHLPDRVIAVTSAGPKDEPSLAHMLVPSAAALLPVVGGSLPALHARVAKHMLLGAGKEGLRASALRERYRHLIAVSNYAGMPDRDEASDAVISGFIRKELRMKPGLKHTPALRLWRDSGHACEQRRFKLLFNEVTSSHAK